MWFVKLLHDQSYFYKYLQLEKEIHHHIHLFFATAISIKIVRLYSLKLMRQDWKMMWLAVNPL